MLHPPSKKGKTMALRSRRAEEKQQRFEAILDAAEQVFFDKSFGKTSMDEIATRAQLSRGLLYVYFKDKDAIMRGIMLRSTKSLKQRFADALHTGENGAAQISSIGMAFYDFSREESDYFDVLPNLGISAEADKFGEVEQAILSSRSEIKQIMVQALENGINDKTLDANKIVDPVLTAYCLQGAMHGVIMLSRNRGEHIDDLPEPEVMVRHTIKMLNLLYT
ncbi:MAG: AcrR family transcriptional regulator [Candidatus Azotimanducaceae bacterium]